MGGDHGSLRFGQLRRRGNKSDSRGEDCTPGIVGIDIVWQKLTLFCDRLTGVPSHRLYAAVDDNDGSGYRPVSIAMARKFRANSSCHAGGWRGAAMAGCSGNGWLRERTRLSEIYACTFNVIDARISTHMFRTHTLQHECDVPLATLTEFGEGWLLYALKLVGLVSLLCMFVMIASWQDIHRRYNGSNSERENSSGMLSRLLSRLSSAECESYSVVCLDEACDMVADKHECPAPSPVNAIPCIAVKQCCSLHCFPS